MLSKCVLCVPPRAGKAHKNQRLAYTRTRLRRWLAGERASLWNSAPLRNTNHAGRKLSTRAERTRRHARACDLCGERAFAKATASLTANPPVDHTAAAVAELRAKHPSAQSPVDLTSYGAANTGSVPVVDRISVERAIRSFHAHSAAGPSGLRPAFLKDALCVGHRDEVLEHLTSMVGVLAQGRAPAALAPHLAGATLHALRKKDDTLRPIAIGECMRRLTAKTLCAASKEQASQLLWPLQIGVAMPLGTEVGLRTARQWMERHSADVDAVFVKVDFKNAFNTVSRQAFLEQCRLHMPGLSPWAEWCYSNPSNLSFGSTTIASESGVQQGDPLGPLLFALALQPLLGELAQWRTTPEGAGLELVFSYLDDLCLAGDFRTVSFALARLTAAARQLGLELSPDKCEVIPAAGRLSNAQVSAFPPETKWLGDKNFELLGGPVGDDSFCNEHTGKRVQKAMDILKAIGEMPDPQVALLLLRYCASFSKLVYSARVVPPHAHAQALEELDAAVRECFESFTSLHPDDTAWKQATLGGRHGGLGLRSLASHSAAAFLASGAACDNLCRQLDNNYTWDPAAPQTSANQALEAFNAAVDPENRVTPNDGEIRQQVLSRHIDEKIYSNLKDPSRANLAYQAHLGLVSAPDAGRWLFAVPAKDSDDKVEPTLFVTMLQRRLRMQIFDSPHYCPFCDDVVDIYGDHCLVCSGGGDRTKRHNLLRNQAHKHCLACGLSSELERPGLLRPRPLIGGLAEDGSKPDGPHQEARRPADVYIPRWRRGIPACLDFAVTSGLRPDRVRDSARDHTSATLQYEGFKCDHLETATLCRAEGMQFIPMVIEACGGGWGAEAAKTWAELAKQSALASGEHRSTCAAQILGSLSVTLHKENARAVIRRAPRVDHTLGASTAAATLAAAAA